MLIGMSSATPGPADSQSVSHPSKRIETVLCVVASLLVALFYVWTAFEPTNSWVFALPQPEGYYNLQTAGFRSGHLYAAIEPNPGLLALSDPYDPWQTLRTGCMICRSARDTTTSTSGSLRLSSSSGP